MTDIFATDPPSLKSFGAAGPHGRTQIIFAEITDRWMGLLLDKPQIRL